MISPFTGQQTHCVVPSDIIDIYLYVGEVGVNASVN